eukprot:1540250-Rhodomonas_salina.4
MRCYGATAPGTNLVLLYYQGGRSVPVQPRGPATSLGGAGTVLHPVIKHKKPQFHLCGVQCCPRVGCYAVWCMSGTDEYGMALRTCYALSGTHTGYGLRLPRNYLEKRGKGPGGEKVLRHVCATSTDWRCAATSTNRRYAATSTKLCMRLPGGTDPDVVGEGSARMGAQR